MTFSIFLLIIVFITAIQTAIPFFVKRTVVFGVTIPEPFIHHDRLKAFKKQYAFIVLLLSIIMLGLYSFWVLTNRLTDEQIVLTGTVIQFGTIFISMSLYFYFHGKTVQLKRNNKWGENLKQVKVSDIGVHAQDEMIPWYFYLLPIFITVGLIGYIALQYDNLPAQIPTHWGPSGQPDAFTEKTPISAISMPLVFLMLLFMFLGIHLGTKNSGIKLSATSLTASRKRQLTLRKYTSWFMYLTSIALTMLQSFFQLTMIHPDLFSNTAMFLAPLVFLGVILSGTIIFAVIVGRSDKITNIEAVGEIMDYDEDSYWKGGLFYFNKNDPSIFVEKRFGIGWTINFANPLAYLIVIVPLVVILLFSFL